MKLSHPFFYWLIGVLGTRLICFFHWTLRVHYSDQTLVEQYHQQGKHVIYAFWHGKLLIPAYTHRKQNIRILISPHRDGEYITQVVRRLGFLPIRGSSNKNAVKALMELKSDASTDIAFALDGPRGPRHQVQAKGILAVAQHLGWPILPGGIAISRKWMLNSWDRFEIPKPFAQIKMKVAEPLFIPKEASDLEPYRLLLQERMQQISQEMEQAFATPLQAL
jgi:lysophospholipid acyltransferase (LPLAT)-like uncharacterized protein